MDSPDLDPRLMHGSLDLHESALKQHLNRFTRFFAPYTIVTHRQTHRPRYV